MVMSSNSTYRSDDYSFQDDNERWKQSSAEYDAEQLSNSKGASSEFLRPQYQYPENPFDTPPKKNFFCGTPDPSPEFRKGNVVFFPDSKGRKPKNVVYYRIADVDAKARRYKLRECALPRKGKSCPELFAEESKKQSDRDREISCLKGEQRLQAEAEEKARREQWLVVYNVMKQQDDQQPLLKVWFDEKKLRLFY